MPAHNEANAGIGKITPRVLRWSREPATRLQVLAIWTFVGVLFGITKSAVAWHLFEISSAASLAFFLWPLIEGPFRLHAKGYLPLRANYRVIQDQTEPDLRSYRAGDLMRLGFTFAGQLVQPAGERNVAVRLEVFLHPQNKDSAQLAQIVSGLRTTPVLIFKTRFVDDFAFETSDAHSPHMFGPDPNSPVFRFPVLRSTHDLYRLHCAIKEQFFHSHQAALADKEGEVAKFIARTEIAHQRLADSGDYKLAPSGDHYVYTWRGAIRQAWLAAWPVKPFRQLRLQSRAMKTAQQLGLPINAKLGRLQDSMRRPDAAQ